MAEAKRMRDVLPQRPEVANQLKTDDVLGVELTITQAIPQQGTKGEFRYIVATGKKWKGTIGFSCGGQVVVRKVTEALKASPEGVVCTITKVKNYYDVN